MTSGSQTSTLLIGDVEMRRHDADDGAAHAVDLDLRADHSPGVPPNADFHNS